MKAEFKDDRDHVQQFSLKKGSRPLTGQPKFPAGAGRRLNTFASTSTDIAQPSADPRLLSSSDAANLEGPSISDAVMSSNVINRRSRGPSILLDEIDSKIAEYEAKLGDGITERRRDEIRAYLDSPSIVLIPSGFAEYIWPGISMSDIARSTGMTLGGISRIFNGKRKARKHTLISIANLYTDGDVDAVEAVIKERVEGRNRRRAS